MTLTKDNAEDGLTIKNKQNPEWGRWRLQRTTNGRWTIHNGRNSRALAPGEFHFWEIV